MDGSQDLVFGFVCGVGTSVLSRLTVLGLAPADVAVDNSFAPRLVAVFCAHVCHTSIAAMT